MTKVCSERKNKSRPNVLGKEELIEMAIKKGMGATKARRKKKKELCKYLKIKWKPRVEFNLRKNKKYDDVTPCDARRSKRFPNAPTKKELVSLAIKKFDLTKSHANSMKKSELCKLLDLQGVVVPPCISRSKLKLKPHQKKVVEYISDDSNRGLVVAHGVGSGKTLTAVAASQCVLDKHPKWKVIVVTPVSLQDNFKKEMEAYGISSNDKRYEFYTIGKFARKYGTKKCPSKHFLIVDEAHHLRTDIDAALKNQLARKKSGKSISGPPRAATMIRCAKSANKVLLLTATPIYNTPYDLENLRAMVSGEKPMSKREFDKLSDSQILKRYTCYFDFFSPPLTKDYPKLVEKNVKIKMTDAYYKQYRKIEERQSTMFTDPWKFLTGMRQATNALKGCQKCKWAVDKIKRGEKTIVYSAFKANGVKLLQKMLDRAKIKYYSITGDVSMKKRTQHVNDFNSNKVKVLFITKAGGEGLDLKGVRNVIILESGWNRPGEEQIIGRAVRYKSHAHLPASKRKVSVYHLVLTKPRRKKGESRSVDVVLKERIADNYKINQNLIKKLKRKSLEKC